MKFVKNHLGLILPLFAILFAVLYLLAFDRVISYYEKRLKDQYTVIVVARKWVEEKTLQALSPLIDSVEKIPSRSVLRRLQTDLDAKERARLQTVIPNFFLIKLKRYPDKKSLEHLKRKLQKKSGVMRVQIFEKMHDRLYEMLLFMKSNFYMFGALIGAIGFLLVMKQMTIWQLEHSERMRIMALFGAPMWLRSGVLFRLALVDALIAVGLSVGSMQLLIRDRAIKVVLDQMGLGSMVLLSYQDIALLLAVALLIALFSAFWVVLRFREDV